MTELYQSLSIPNGTASTMLYSCPNGGEKPSSVRHADIWDRFSMGWRGKRNARFSKGI